jgi:hypothetical protein
MEKQPNSRMCFVCGIDNPIGLHLSFYTDDEGRCIARFPVPDRLRRSTPSYSPDPGREDRPARARAPGLPRPSARRDHQHTTGRPNSNFNAL